MAACPTAPLRSCRTTRRSTPSCSATGHSSRSRARFRSRSRPRSPASWASPARRARSTAAGNVTPRGRSTAAISRPPAPTDACRRGGATTPIEIELAPWADGVTELVIRPDVPRASALERASAAALVRICARRRRRAPPTDHRGPAHACGIVGKPTCSSCVVDWPGERITRAVLRPPDGRPGRLRDLRQRNAPRFGSCDRNTPR